jgi:hypothetical protein
MFSSMSTINSTSTRQQVLAAMADNASYAEDNSVAKANAFVTACNVWISVWAFTNTKTGSSELQMPVAMIERRILAAQKWLAGQGQPMSKVGGNVVRVGVSNFRDDFSPGPGGGCGGSGGPYCFPFGGHESW